MNKICPAMIQSLFLKGEFPAGIRLVSRTGLPASTLGKEVATPFVTPPLVPAQVPAMVRLNGYFNASQFVRIDKAALRNLVRTKGSAVADGNKKIGDLIGISDSEEELLQMGLECLMLGPRVFGPLSENNINNLGNLLFEYTISEIMKMRNIGPDVVGQTLERLELFFSRNLLDRRPQYISGGISFASVLKKGVSHHFPLWYLLLKNEQLPAEIYLMPTIEKEGKIWESPISQHTGIENILFLLKGKEIDTVGKLLEARIFFI